MMISRKKGKSVEAKPLPSRPIDEDLSVKFNEQLELKVIVKVGKKVMEQDVDKSLHIPSAGNLTASIIKEQLAINPSLHARWNMLYNEAVYEYDELKIALEIWCSQTAKDIRVRLQDETNGRVTDKMVEDNLKIHSDYKKQNRRLNMAKRNMKHIYSLANGFGEKGDKLVYLASMLKSEMESFSKGIEAKKNLKVPLKSEAKDVKDQYVKSEKTGWPVKVKNYKQ